MKFDRTTSKRRKRIRTRKKGEERRKIFQRAEARCPRPGKNVEQRANIVTKGFWALASSILTETSVFYSLKEELHRASLQCSGVSRRRSRASFTATFHRFTGEQRSHGASTLASHAHTMARMVDAFKGA